MNIPVILTQDDPKLGKRGQVVKVSSGFAGNFLFPHGKALPATPGNLKKAQADKERADKAIAQEKALAQFAAQKIEQTPLVLKVLAGEEDKLYGAVTSLEIVKELAGLGITLDRKSIQLEEPLRRLGNYSVKVKLHPEIHTTLKIQVVKKKDNG
ncbi:MAG: 50S ribosomal protein L9 [Candidatus Omnitrophica bacterium]|nr:50S ribosomal protein L9 [Candidatus Omnitrophota bacterium]